VQTAETNWSKSVKLVEKEFCYIFDDFFGPSVIAGFTKDTLKGMVPRDIKKTLSFLEEEYKLAYLKQIHSSRINFIKKDGESEGDGLFSKDNNLVMIVRTADCLPLFFASQEEQIFGVMHMGWKPAQQGILENIGFNLASFKVAAGVGLRKCCYRVGEEFLEFSSFRPFLEKRQSGFYFDPIDFAREYLWRKGLPRENFFDTGICPLCSSGFFSYRKDKTQNRTLSFIVKQSSQEASTV
jgi:copper oxidase (laccase) domain-containing protein